MRSCRVQSWLTRHTALEPTLLQGAAACHLIDARLKQSGCADKDAYVALLQSSTEELEQLISGIAVPETWFFRYPRSFDCLAGHLSGLRARRPDGEPLRMLSAACATGEEACSMAITAMHAGWPANQMIISAFDICSEQINRARRGVYRSSAIRGELPTWARRWITSANGELRVAREIVEAIEYQHLDLLNLGDSGDETRFDVIFCRNLFIYLNENARKRLIDLLAAHLAQDGLLFVGHAEQPGVLSGVFQPVPLPSAFALRATNGEDKESQATRPGRRQDSHTIPHRTPHRAKAPARTPTSLATPTPVRPAAPEQPSLTEARALADRGDLKRALRAAKAVIATKGPDVAALELLGSVELAMGRTLDARDCFRKAIYLEPERAEALLQLALIHEQLSQTDLAERYRQRAARAHQKHSEDA